MRRTQKQPQQQTQSAPASSSPPASATAAAQPPSESELFGDSSADMQKALCTFVLFKAFDLISDGEYKKLVVRSKDNGDVWAEDVYAQVHLVNNLIRKLINEIQTLDDYGKSRLRRVCTEIMAAVTPPARRRPGWSLCSITGLRSDECIDLTRVGKSTSVVTVHRRFSHFVLMLWYVVKFEHMCKIMARHWLSHHHFTDPPSEMAAPAAKGPKTAAQNEAAATHDEGSDDDDDSGDAAGAASPPDDDDASLSPAADSPLDRESQFVSSMCADFQQQQQTVIEAMASGFRHAFLHSMRSIRAHKDTPDAEVLLHAAAAGDTAKNNPRAPQQPPHQPPPQQPSNKRARRY